jgi:hypothetical protein
VDARGRRARRGRGGAGLGLRRRRDVGRDGGRAAGDRGRLAVLGEARHRGRGGRRRRAARDAAARRAGRLARRRGERGAPEVAGRRVARRGLLGQRAGDDRVERERHARRRRRPGRLLVQVGGDRRRHGGAAERRRAGERGVQHAAERVDVGAGVDRLAAEVLGRHEVDGPDPAAALGDPRRLGVLDAGDPEVAEVDVRARDQHVRGLDVAVHEAGGVRGVEGAADLRDDRGRPARREPPLAAQERVEVRARDVAHDQVEVAVLLAGAVDRDHVRVVDRRGQPRLALEALAERRVRGAVGGDQLQRDRPAEAKLRRAVDDAHAAGAEQLLDAAAGELRSGGQVGHPRPL